MLCKTQNYTIEDFSYIQMFKQKRLNYPIKFTYVNKITTWWPPKQTLLQLGLPSQTSSGSYNYIALAFWTCQRGPTDISKLWDDPITYFGQQIAQSKIQTQKYLKRKYNQKGISIILSAFGATQKPTTLKLDPIICAQKLGKYVKQNLYDGVDIDYEDNQAMKIGTAQNWLISFMKQLRKILPYHIISQAPQAPYFMPKIYPNGGYLKIHKQVGNLTDFYNIQFYNQLQTNYLTYDQLFLNSGLNSPQTSVLQLIKNGIPSNMIVIGKPVAQTDIYNTGYVHQSKLIEFTIRAYKQLNWKTGFMFWQFSSDLNGSLINKMSSILQALNRK